MAQHVREIFIEDTDDSESRRIAVRNARYYHDDLAELSDEDVSFFDELMKTHGLQPVVRRMDKEKSGLLWSDLNGIMALLLLCMSPKAHTATLDMVNKWDLAPFRAQPLVQPAAFPNLRSLTLTKRRGLSFFLDQLAPLLHAAPGIEDLSLTQCDGVSMPLNLSRLRTATFKSCMLGYRDLRRLLDRSTELETFVSKEDGRRGGGTAFWQAYPAQVIEVLHPATASLKHIDIDLSRAHADFWEKMGYRVSPIEADTGGNANLDQSRARRASRLRRVKKAALPTLETLAINITAIEPGDGNALVDLIENCPLLRQLVICQVNRFKQLEDSLQRLGEQVAGGRFPELTRVEVHFGNFRAITNNHEIETFDALKALFADGGVQLHSL